MALQNNAFGVYAFNGVYLINNGKANITELVVSEIFQGGRPVALLKKLLYLDFRGKGGLCNFYFCLSCFKKCLSVHELA